MKRTAITILAIAIIGALGVYGKSHGGNNSLSPPASNTSSLQPMASSNPASSNTMPHSPMASGSFKDGSYTGDAIDTPYGTVQIAVVVSGGKISDINFLQLPNDLGHSQEVSAYASPLLKQETIQRQSSNIDFVSGATVTSEGYDQSLQSALNQAA